MNQALRNQCYGVLLPAFADLRLSPQVKAFLAGGGRAILLGETREEYVARRMSKQRETTESAAAFATLTAEARSLAGDLIVGVDQELGGICRLHHLVPQFPSAQTIEELDPDSLQTICSAVASAARDMGVNCFLAPILDLVSGENPWLAGRTWSTDPHRVAEVSSLFIKTIQNSGVASVAKHFPGFSNLVLDPAVDPEARNSQPLSSFKDAFIPFAEAIGSGVEAIMTGPAIVDAFDPERSASVSSEVISMLRTRLGFGGLVVSDDLDGQAILRGRPITELAVQALIAGSDLLLIGDIDDQVERIATAIMEAVGAGELDEARLTEAASRVRGLVKKYRV